MKFAYAWIHVPSGSAGIDVQDAETENAALERIGKWNSQSRYTDAGWQYFHVSAGVYAEKIGSSTKVPPGAPHLASEPPEPQFNLVQLRVIKRALRVARAEAEKSFELFGPYMARRHLDLFAQDCAELLTRPEFTGL